MAPCSYDYEVEGGDCLPLHVVLKDGSDTPLDLTGYSSEFVATWRTGSVTLSSGSELEIAEAGESPTEDGSISGQMTGVQTADLPLGKLTRYEWSVTEPGGCKRTFLKGFITRT
jgi:hypothetical protein